LFSVANDSAMQAKGKGHLSCSRADTTFFGVERDASIKRGPACRLRRDGKLTFHQMDSFTHADERTGTPGPLFRGGETPFLFRPLSRIPDQNAAQFVSVKFDSSSALSDEVTSYHSLPLTIALAAWVQNRRSLPQV